MSSQKKELDFEINLMPVLSIMSLCICFLLTIAVWNRLGMISVQQAIGDVLPVAGVNPDSLLIKVHKSKQVVIEFKDGKNEKDVTSIRVNADTKGKVNIEAFKKSLAQMLSKTGMEVKTVLVMPENSVPYGDTIKIMDSLKSQKLNVGLAPSVSEEIL
jgi:biopolymer transport protein ExbD